MKHRSTQMQSGERSWQSPPADTAFDAEFLDSAPHSCSVGARKIAERGEKASQAVLDISHIHAEFRPVIRNHLLCRSAVPTWSIQPVSWPVATQIPDGFKKTKSDFFLENQILAA